MSTQGAEAPQHAHLEQRPLLEVRNVAVRYPAGGLGVSDVSLSVNAGQVAAVLGANGAGKTTTARAISGYVRSERVRVVRGTIVVDGEDVTGIQAHEMTTHGVFCVPERHKVFPRLSVAENLTALGGLMSRRPSRAALAQVLELFPVLAERRRELVGRLSGGQQQMLAIARGLLCKPRLLILDEATLGLHPSVQNQLLLVLRQVIDMGTAVLLLDENLDFVLEIAQHCYLLDAGRTVKEGSVDLFRSEGASLSELTGRERVIPTDESSTIPNTGVMAVVVEKLTARFGGITALDEVSFEVPESTILALVGPNGAGKTTCLNALCGLVRNSSGIVTFYGRDITRLSPARLVQAGFGRSFQHPPLVEGFSVVDSIMCGGHSVLGYSGFDQVLRRKRVKKRERELEDSARDLLRRFHLTRLSDTPVAALSYGDRKLVDILRAIVTRPRLLCLDEPTSGLGEDEHNVVQQLILELRNVDGSTIIVVEHHMDLVRAVADDVVVLQAGRAIMQGSPLTMFDTPEFRAVLLGGA